MSAFSTTGIPPAVQSAWKQLQLDQARQFAERAAMAARSLQAKANAAQSVANQAIADAQTLNTEASQAQNVATQAEFGVRTVESSNQLGANILKVINQSVPTQAAAIKPAPIVNTQGETIGTLLNVAA